MSYDYGTNTLGIKNPFKPEGILRAVAGLVIGILGVAILLGISKDLKVDSVKAWSDVFLGIALLTWSFKKIGNGLFKLFRYFVGRSVPTSLALNRNPSDQQNAIKEKDSTAYNSATLESMLMGRKNSTFHEPQGWTAQLIHSVFPKLIFMPYKIRNFVQELAGLVVSSTIAFVAFSLAYFVSVSGLVGNAGRIITPILSILLLIYMVGILRSSARSLRSAKNRTLHSKSSSSLALLTGFAIIVPIATGYVYSHLSGASKNNLHSFFENTLVFSAWFNLILLIVISIGVIAVSWVMIRERFNLADPETHVSEFRANMQESVHPKEIFINIDNIVLANRRFKEIPNRIYQEFNPELEEQSQGKGSFKGKLLIETQPEPIEIAYSPLFKKCRMLATIASQIMIVVSAILLIFLVSRSYELYSLSNSGLLKADNGQTRELLVQFGSMLTGCLTLFFSWQTIYYAGKLLERGSSLFWSEMQFGSLLMWMKAEGTYTESKISTGMAIHDSTRSENVVVRSSITPWIITSRITTSLFAESGTQNLEQPRHILKMSSNDDELNTIVAEIKTFLEERESIASIGNEKDLRNAATFYQINQTSMAHSTWNANNQPESLEEEGAAKLIQDDC